MPGFDASMPAPEEALDGSQATHGPALKAPANFVLGQSCTLVSSPTRMVVLAQPWGLGQLGAFPRSRQTEPN